MLVNGKMAIAVCGSGSAMLDRRPLVTVACAVPGILRFDRNNEYPGGTNDANPHGMAIKFHLPAGSDTDMVINSLKFFPVATGEDFRDLLLALAASPPDPSERRMDCPSAD
jgi:catalase